MSNIRPKKVGFKPKKGRKYLQKIPRFLQDKEYQKQLIEKFKQNEQNNSSLCNSMVE